MIIAFLVFFPMLFGAAAWLAGRKDPRRALYTAIWAVILELILTLFLQTGERGFAVPGVFAGGLSFQTDGFRRIYCLTVSILWTGSTVFSL
ncbi:MAG: hypothetical protein IKN57_13990, partial [Parasporobacterium sp.]|nr:hypothetical protein [Parasporobacterium sp.]